MKWLQNDTYRYFDKFTPFCGIFGLVPVYTPQGFAVNRLVEKNHSCQSHIYMSHDLYKTHPEPIVREFIFRPICSLFLFSIHVLH